MNRVQYAFRLWESELLIIDKHAQYLSEISRCPVTRSAALRDILHWFGRRQEVLLSGQEALKATRARAEELSLDKLTEEEINAEIHAARAARKEKKDE